MAEKNYEAKIQELQDLIASLEDELGGERYTRGNFRHGVDTAKPKIKALETPLSDEQRAEFDALKREVSALTVDLRSHLDVMHPIREKLLEQRKLVSQTDPSSSVTAEQRQANQDRLDKLEAEYKGKMEEFHEHFANLTTARKATNELGPEMRSLDAEQLKFERNTYRELIPAKDEAIAALKARLLNFRKKLRRTEKKVDNAGAGSASAAADKDD